MYHYSQLDALCTDGMNSKLSKMVDQDTQINFEQIVNENEPDQGYLMQYESEGAE